MMKNERITSELLSILQNDFNVDCKGLPHNVDLPLTGTDVGLKARDLMYLCYKIEEIYKIRFEERDLRDYRMNSVSGLTELILLRKDIQL